MVEVDVKEAFKLPDGDHTGTITAVQEREPKGFRYIDLLIEMPDLHKIKVSFPNNVTPVSTLGKCIERFGTAIGQYIGTKLNLDAVFVGKQVMFKSITDGQYSKVLGDSLMPAVVTENVKDPVTEEPAQPIDYNPTSTG